MEAARMREAPCDVGGLAVAAMARGVYVAITPLGEGLGSSSRSTTCKGSTSDSCMTDECESRLGLDVSEDNGEADGG